MKKTMKQVLSLCIFGIHTILTMGQNPIWSLPDNIINLPYLSTSPIPTFFSPYTSTHNAYPAPDGSLGFYVVDEYVYDGNGALVGAMWLPTNSGGSQWPETRGFSEIAIAPHPTDCNRFYIMSANTQYWQNTPLAVEITYQPNSIPKYAMTDTIDLIQHLEAQAGVPLFAVNPYDATGLFYAVSPDLINGKRVFYISNGVHSIIKASISNSGIQYESHFSISTTGVSARTEMELFKKSSGYILAIPYQESNINNNILLLDLDVNGDFIPNSEKFISLPYNSATSLNYVVHGLEFSPNGKYLYFTGKTNGLPSLGIFNYVNLLDTTLTPVPLALSTNSDFQYSHIELGLDGKLYFAHTGGLASYSNPDNPGMGAFVFNAVSSSYAQTNFWNGSTPVLSAFTLPDQIDGFDYMGHYLNNIQCCIQNSTYDKWEYKSISGSYTWEPGSNPITSTTNNSVFIRDSLVINLNSNITIKNMTFVFAPDAKVVVHGGVVGQQGGKLTLDNSTFTVDTSCAKKMWNGIKVLGNPSYAQGTVSNSIQGWVVLKNNSKIMHARVGIEAGNYVNMNTSTRTGGVVQATNASFINNKMGVRLLHYNSPSGNGNAAHQFTDTRFLTNGILIETAAPQHLQLFGVKGVNIMGCSFENLTPNLYVQGQKGRGIYSYNSSFQVNQRCTSYTQPAGYPCYGIPTVFKNLQTGVFAQSTSLHHVGIQESYFENNAQGIAVHGNANPHIIGNDFFVLKDPNYNSYGLYLYNTPALTVEENFFTEFGNSGDPSGGSSYGVIVYNSGQNLNTVYRNTFENIKVGGQAQGTNGLLTSNWNNSGHGLRFICNNFEGNIYEADLAISSGRIANLQGVNLSISTDPNQIQRAGNLFSASSYTLENNYWVNPGALSIQYSHHLPNATYRTEPVLRNLTEVLTSVGTTYYDPSIHCKTKAYKPIKPGVIGAIVMKMDSIELERKAILSSINGGQTDIYLEMLQNNEWQDVIYSAQEFAPLISDEVILGLISSNIDISELESFLEICSPLSVQVQDAYKEAYGLVDLGNLEYLQEGYTKAPRQQIYYSAAILEIEKDNLYKDGLFLISENDSNYLEDMLLLIGSDNNEVSINNRIQLYLSHQNYILANEELSNFSANSDVKDFYSFILPHYENNFEIMDENPIDFMNDLSAFADITAAHCLYLTLNYGDSIEFEIEPLIESKSKSYTYLLSTENKLYDWEIYPNPSSFVLQFKGLEVDEIYQVEIIDLTGRLIKTERISGNGILDISTFKNGIYSVRIKDVNGKVETRNLVKIN